MMSSKHTQFTQSKIYYPQNVIEINRQPLPVYQTVIEKTRGLAFRTQAIGAAIIRTPATAQPEEAQPAVVEGAR